MKLCGYLFFVSIALVTIADESTAQLRQLATRVPANSNAIVVVDVQRVLSSPLAQESRWSAGRRNAARSGMLGLPPEVDWFLMAADIDYEFFEPVWEIAAAYVPNAPGMQEIADHSGGRIDRLAGSNAVQRPNDSYVVALGPRILGARSPANRQQVIRWIRESRTKQQPDLSRSWPRPWRL